MAITDIPQFLKAQPGDLIRAADWNSVQQLVRNSIRTHHHTRPVTTPPQDSGSSDDAQQIGSNEIADGAIAASKMGSNAVTNASLADNAVSTTKLADNAVTGAKISNGSITAGKLSFSTVNSGGLTLAPSQNIEVLVQQGAPSTKTTIYFPTLSILSSSGSGISDITAQIVYRQSVGASTVDVYIRLINAGAATAGIVWQVLTFSQ